jgi:hypothetical protein
VRGEAFWQVANARSGEIAKALRVSVMTIHRWRKMLREREFPCSRAENMFVLGQPVIGNQTAEAGALSPESAP